MLGIPVVATNAGGTSSLVKHEQSGLLVPVNDPYLMASNILRILTDISFSEILGDKGREVALKRHSSNSISESLMNIFAEILTNN